MLSRQDLIKILRLKKITMCTKAFCNRYRCNIKCYTIQRKKLNKKYILNFSFNRKSRKNIFVYREIFFPQDRKIEKKRKSRKIISTRNFHFAKSKKTFSFYKRRNNKHFKRNQRHSKIPFHLKERLLKITFLFLSICGIQDSLNYSNKPE